MRGVQACVNAALCVHGNPLLGAGPKKKPPKEDWEALMEWEHETCGAERAYGAAGGRAEPSCAHCPGDDDLNRSRVRPDLVDCCALQAKMSAMERQHLRRFTKELRKLEAWEELEK
eukprot:475895-Rhodomonas_salina.1